MSRLHNIFGCPIGQPGELRRACDSLCEHHRISNIHLYHLLLCVISFKLPWCLIIIGFHKFWKNGVKYLCIYHDNSSLLVTCYLVESCFIMYIRHPAFIRNVLGRISDSFASFVIIIGKWHLNRFLQIETIYWLLYLQQNYVT